MLKSKDYPEVLIAEPLAFQGLPLKLRDILFFGISLVMPNFGITRRFLQLAGGKDLKMQEVLSSLNWPEWLKRRGLCIFFLKTCLGSFRMTEAGRLASSSPRFMTWGIMSNGLCLTANILESLNQDGGCSLSDILIPDAPEKYFLSLEQMKKLLYRSSMDGWANESMILPESPARRTPADNPDSTL